MTSDQRTAVLVFSWLNYVTFASVTAGVLCFQIAKVVTKYFRPSVDSVGNASNILYRDVNGISAYIPQVISKKLLLPIVCCDMSTVPLRHYPLIMNSTIGEATDPKVINNKKLEEFIIFAWMLIIPQCLSII